MSVCTATEIAEKRRIALAKLQAKKNQTPVINSNTKPATSVSEQLGAKSASNFYKSPPQNNTKTVNYNNNNVSQNKSSAFLNALKAIKSTSARELGRAAAHPYQRPNGANRPSLTLSPEKEQPQQQLASVFTKSINCKIYLISAQRFAVVPSGFHQQLIEVFKNMPSKSYDAQTRIWDFDLKDYQLLQQHVGDLKPHVVIGSIPKKVIDLCKRQAKPIERSVLASIEEKLVEMLMPFQEEGVW